MFFYRSANADIRGYARAMGVSLWRLADAEGVSEPTIHRRLRKELPEEEKARYKSIIDKLAEGETVCVVNNN